MSKSNLSSVFLVQHEREDGDGHSDVKLIGVYSSLERAKRAINKLRAKQGFSDRQGPLD